MENIIWFVLIGLAAGFLAGIVVKGHGFGMLGNIVVGIVGAVIGGVLLGVAGISVSGTLGGLVSAFLGAIALLVIVGFLKRRGA